MGKMTTLPGPHSRLRTLIIITLVFLILASMWIFYDLYAYSQMRANPVSEEFPDNGLGIGLIIRILLYGSFAFMMFRAFENGLKTSPLTVICTLTGVVSGIAIVPDWAALVDIYHDYRSAGGCIMEWTWLFISLAVQLTFFISGFLLIFSLMKGKTFATPTAKPAVNEAFFEITQYVGIVCGLAGFAFTVFADVSLQGWKFGSWLIKLLLFYCLAIILPYISMVIFWLLRIARRAEANLYDEKQKHDLALAGLTAWLASIPVMAVVFIFDYADSGSETDSLWLPYYMFSTLSVFSISLLLRFKKG